MAQVPPRHELIRMIHDDWNINHGVDDETLRDIGYETVETLPATIERAESIGEQPVAQFAQLELVKPAEPETSKEAKKLATKRRRIGARDQAWGETTPADDGSWSNDG